MKNIKENILYIIVVVLGLLAVYRLYNYLYVEEDKVNYIDAASVVLKESLKINGHTLQDINLVNINTGKKESILKELNNDKALVLLYSDLTCNICTDSLVQNCKQFSTKGMKVIGIAHSYDLHYLQRFAKINNINFTMYYDEEKALVNAMGINLLPSVLLINEEKEILNSIFVTPQTKNYTKIFFNNIEKTALPKGNN